MILAVANLYKINGKKDERHSHTGLKELNIYDWIEPLCLIKIATKISSIGCVILKNWYVKNTHKRNNIKIY